MRRFVTGFGLCLVLACASCSAQSSVPRAGTPSGGPTASQVAQARNAGLSGGASAARPSPPVPTPDNVCPGGNTYASDLYLVESGEATVAAEVTITAAPESSQTVHHDVPVSSATTVAGVLTNGPINQIDEVLGEVGEGAPNALAPGTYLVLLGAISESPNTYYLADSMAGSFTLAADGSASEQCPNYNDPSSPDHGPAVAESALIQNLVTALH